MNSEKLSATNSVIENSFGVLFNDTGTGSGKTALCSPSLSPPPWDESYQGDLFDSPEQSNQIRVEYESELRSELFVELNETEVHIEFSPSVVDVKQQPQCVTDIDCIQAKAASLPNLRITDITGKTHICNGSHSNISKGIVVNSCLVIFYPFSRKIIDYWLNIQVN